MRSTLLLILAIGGGVARAEDDFLKDITDIADLDIADLLGEVDSASMFPEARATAPAAVFVMEREEIAATGARTIPELLWSVPP